MDSRYIAAITLGTVVRRYALPRGCRVGAENNFINAYLTRHASVSSVSPRETFPMKISITAADEDSQSMGRVPLFLPPLLINSPRIARDRLQLPVQLLISRPKCLSILKVVLFSLPYFIFFISHTLYVTARAHLIKTFRRGACVPEDRELYVYIPNGQSYFGSRR